MIGGGAELAVHCRSLIAGRDAPLQRVQFGPAVVEVGFNGFSDAAGYGQALCPAPGRAPAVFSVHVIDGDACDVPRPRLAWCAADFGPKRIVPGWSGLDHTTYLLRSEGGFAFADWAQRWAVIWLPSAAAVPWYERAAPFRWLFDNLAARLGMATLHAGAVGRAGAGVLLAGRGGAGKSTLALACLGRGLDYVADDYCLLSLEPRPVAHRLYSTAKWKTDAPVAAAWLKGVASHGLDGGQQKAVLRLDMVRPERLVSSLEITAILAPVIADVSDPRLEPIAPAAALGFLAASTLAQAELDNSRPIAAMGRLVRSVSAYRLLMPPDPERSVSAIEAWLDAAA